MSEEIRLDGIGVAPGVLDTIVTLAAEGVEGVAGVATPKLARVSKKAAAKGVTVEVAEDGVVAVGVHVNVVYGRPLREIGREVQAAVADALTSQTGQQVADVDVFVDAIAFEA